jgi:hypothetical protein
MALLTFPRSNVHLYLTTNRAAFAKYQQYLEDKMSDLQHSGSIEILYILGYDHNTDLSFETIKKFVKYGRKLRRIDLKFIVAALQNNHHKIDLIDKTNALFVKANGKLSTVGGYLVIQRGIILGGGEWWCPWGCIGEGLKEELWVRVYGRDVLNLGMREKAKKGTGGLENLDAMITSCLNFFPMNFSRIVAKLQLRYVLDA